MLFALVMIYSTATGSLESARLDTGMSATDCASAAARASGSVQVMDGASYIVGENAAFVCEAE